MVVISDIKAKGTFISQISQGHVITKILKDNSKLMKNLPS